MVDEAITPDGSDDALSDIASSALIAAFASDDEAPAGETPSSSSSVAPRSTLSSGHVLAERYEIHEEIGAGGMGKVYAATDRTLGRRVAVKVLAVSGSDAFDPERLFEREARLLASIQHPNLVAIHEVGHDDDVTFLVMDLVEGVAASEVLRRVARVLSNNRPRHHGVLRDALAMPVPEGRHDLVSDGWFRSVARIVLTAARTLQAAHAEGLLHRDIKPQNLMLRGDGSPVILDFGLASARGQGGTAITRGLFGSVAYLAPEQARMGSVGTDPRTDVYQMGATLYEFLTLKRAFPGDSPTEVLDKVAKGAFVPPRSLDRGIPYELEAICLRAMEPAPSRRYASMKDLADDLERWVVGTELPHAARSRWITAPVRRLRWFARAHRGTSLAAAALLVGALTTWALVEPEPASLVTPFRDPVDATSMQVGDEIVSVGEGDLLGIIIETEEPQYVWALSVYGDPSDATWVLPLLAQAPPGDDAGAVEVDDWALRTQVPAGRTFLTCAEVGPAHPKIDFEGLWVFTSPNPQPSLSQWLRELDDTAYALDDGVPMGMAMACLDVETLRGHPTAPSRNDEGLTKRLKQALERREEDWPFEDPRRFAFRYPVARE